jgi:RNA polymerase sigma-70 factor (ECF subfamily)
MGEERAWIQRALAGDQEAFACLVEAYQTAVYNLAYRMLGNAVEAEDAAQETFLRAYTRLGTYDPDRKFSSWLLAIASHHCIDRLRRRRFALSLNDLPPWRWLASSSRPEEVVIRSEERGEVRQLLDQLPPHYRAAVVLRYWYDLSYQEIAEAMETTESAVKSTLYRARRKLAQETPTHQNRGTVSLAQRAVAEG